MRVNRWLTTSLTWTIVARLNFYTITFIVRCNEEYVLFLKFWFYLDLDGFICTLNVCLVAINARSNWFDDLYKCNKNKGYVKILENPHEGDKFNMWVNILEGNTCKTPTYDYICPREIKTHIWLHLPKGDKLHLWLRFPKGDNPHIWMRLSKVDNPICDCVNRNYSAILATLQITSYALGV